MTTTRSHNVASPVRHRHQLAALALPADAAGSVLDVGGYRSRAPLVLCERPALEYQSVNTGPAWYGEQAADHTCPSNSLPFADNRFDYVISVDTLEHVEPEVRDVFVREAVRVAARRAVVVFPFRVEDEVTNERHFLDICQRYGIDPMPSLVEHERLGLPTLRDAYRYESEYSATLIPATPKREYWSWQVAMLLNSVASLPDVARTNRVLHEAQERVLASSPYTDDVDDAYRFVLVVDK